MSMVVRNSLAVFKHRVPLLMWTSHWTHKYTMWAKYSVFDTLKQVVHTVAMGFKGLMLPCDLVVYQNWTVPHHPSP